MSLTRDERASLPLNPPQDYRKVERIHRLGLAAARPAPGEVLPGTLYFSTDTGALERSTGDAWEPFAQAAGGTVTHQSGALTANQLVIGNGGADVKALGSEGSAQTVLHGNTGGPPWFAQVGLASDVSGRLPYANLTAAPAAARLLGRGDSGAGDWQPLTLSPDLAIGGTELGLAPIPWITVPYDAANFSDLNHTGLTWTIGDYFGVNYWQRGSLMVINFFLGAVTFSATTNVPAIKIPAGKSPAYYHAGMLAWYDNAGTPVAGSGIVQTQPGSPWLLCLKDISGPNFLGTCNLYGNVIIDI